MPPLPLLTVCNLHVSAEKQEILRGIDLTLHPGEVHVLMGPNGSGKSTLALALLGHPSITVTKGSVRFKNKNLLRQKPHERALSGLFLAFQHPRELEGVTLRHLVTASHQARAATDKRIVRRSPLQLREDVLREMEKLSMAHALLERAVNKGLSGGEKKKSEILQLLALRPSLMILDELDSGLDVDALKTVATAVRDLLRAKPHPAILLITHHAKILKYITPTHVHILLAGKIVKSGSTALVREIEHNGFKPFTRLPATRYSLPALHST